MSCCRGTDLRELIVIFNASSASDGLLADGTFQRTCETIDKDNKTLQELRSRSVKKQTELQETCEKKAKEKSGIQPENGTPLLKTGTDIPYHHSFRDFKQVIAYYENYLKATKEVGDKLGEGRAYGNLGQAYDSVGHFKKAIDYFERYLKIAKQTGDKAAEQNAYNNLGCSHFSIGNFKTAKDYFERDLKIVIEVGDRSKEGEAYCNLGNIYYSLGDFKTAIVYHKRHLQIKKEVGDKSGEGKAYGNLGNAHHGLGDFKTAVNYHERHLQIAIDIKDREGESNECCNLGNDHENLGDFKKAIDYNERGLKIAKEMGDRSQEGRAYSNLGNAYYSLGDFQTARAYHEHNLEIMKKLGDRSGEGKAYGNLGNSHMCLGDYKTARNYHTCDLKLAIEVGDKSEEGKANSSLGSVYYSLGDFKTAINYDERALKIAKELGGKYDQVIAYQHLGRDHLRTGKPIKALDCHEHCLKIAKETGDIVQVAKSLRDLGICYECLGCDSKALEFYRGSVTTHNDIRKRLQSNDKWKISFRNTNQTVYTRLWRLLLKQGNIMEALLAAEEGRAQALKDLMELKYAFETTHAGSGTETGTIHNILSFLPSTTVFIASEEHEIIFWVCHNGRDAELRRKFISPTNSWNDVTTFLQSLLQVACQEIDARTALKCEDRSLNKAGERNLADEGFPTKNRQTESFSFQKSALKTLFDTIFAPVYDLVHGNELVFVPEGPLCLAPFAAFMDSNSKYLCESYRIRVIPSLTSLKLIMDCPADYHRTSGALLVGDPWVQEVTKLEQLPCARQEVEMIGRMLHTVPLIGRAATKGAVLKRLSSVALVHFAAHGRMETGEIALAPNPTPASRKAREEDFMLTMKDVLKVQMRARLVVLSCCHSAHGEIKAEGVVGIARAFLGAGTRSVLVTLWAISDAATLEFMKSFYSNLSKGRSASDALNRAMKHMRESDEFRAVKYWAPFVLIGDDVTIEFGESD